MWSLCEPSSSIPVVQCCYPLAWPLPPACMGWRGTAHTPMGAWHPSVTAVNRWHQPVKGSTQLVSPAPAAAPAHPWEPLMNSGESLMRYFLCPVIFRVQSLRNGHSPEPACKWGLGATRHLFWAPVETHSPGFLQLCNI